MTESDTSLPPWASRQGAVVLAMLETVVDSVQKGIPADRTLHALLSKNKKYGSRDRRLMGDTIFAWFRWHGAIGSYPLPTGLCAAWMLDGREWPPALQAILEELEISEPEILSEDLSLADRKAAVEAAFQIELPPVEQWLPEWYQSETDHLGPWEDRIRDHINRPPTWLRVDRSTRTEIHDALIADGAEWAGEASPCSYSFREAGKVHHWLRSHPEAIEVQDLGSQQVVRICAPKAGELWWDACSGAGGKSLQLLDEANRDLNLTCTDKREEILTELTKRGRRHGLGKVRRYALDLLQEEVTLPNFSFNGILLDAPCSGSGTWQRNPDDAWRTEAKDVEQHGRRQLRMLNAIAPALQNGGHLIYAVCSLTRRETTQVITDFLQANPEYSLAPFTNPLNGETTDGSLFLLPEQTHGDGMFVAKLTRTL
jgi:16S rRNA (cytosine967-C5)-methyltransferase